MTTFAAFDNIDAFEQYLIDLAPGTIGGRAMTQSSCPLARYAKAVDIRLPTVSGIYLTYYTDHDVQRVDPLTPWQEQFIIHVDELAIARFRQSSPMPLMMGYANDPSLSIAREDCLDVLHRVRALGYSSR